MLEFLHSIVSISATYVKIISLMYLLDTTTRNSIIKGNYTFYVTQNI